MSSTSGTLPPTARTNPEKRFESALEHLTTGKVVGSQSELPEGGSSAPPDRRFPKIITLAWLTLGIASVALALIAAMVLRSERESTTVLHHLDFLALDLQVVLSDLADAEAAERGYLLTGRPISFENFERSRKALSGEFDRLTALVQNNPVERQELERVRDIVHQDLDELQRSIASRAAAGSQAAFAEILTDRARKLTEALRQSITGIDREDEGILARLSRQRRVRLASALAAVSGALLLAGCYVLIGQIIIARSASRHQKTQAALHTSEKRFETLCEQAPVGIYGTDAQGLCVYTNRQWSRMSGLSAAESLGHGWKKALHPDDRETIFESWKSNALQGVSWEYRLLTPQGKIRWIRALGGPMYSDRGALTGYVGTLEDVTEHKRAAERFRLVFEAAPSGMVMVNRDGKINLVNSRAEELFGYRREELLGNSIEILVPDASRQKHVEDRSEYYAPSRLVARPMGIGRDLYARRKDSSQFPVEIGLNPIETEDGTCVLSSILDITERKRAEDAVREALQELRLITNNMAAGVSRCGRDLRYKCVSPCYAAWLGRTQEEIVGQTISSVLGREAYEAVAPHIEKVLGGEKEEYETQIKYPSVGSRWIHAVHVPTRGQDDAVDGWITVVADVTVRHEAEERLRESEERFRTMADTAPVMIWMSGPDKLCTFFNKVWLNFRGRTMEQELANGWAEGVHPDDLDRCMATYSASFEARRGFRMEYRLRRADGEYRWILDDGAPRFTNAGLFAGYIGSCIDITERRRADEERQKFVSLADRSLEFIGMCDLDFRPFYINSAGMRLVGLDNLEAACRVEIKDYFFPEDQPFITNEFFPRVLRDGHGAVEIRVRHFKTGAAIWMLFNVFNIFDGRGALVGWATVSINITDRKKAENALRGALQQLQLVTDNMPAAVARYSRDRRYVWASKTYTAWLGRLPDELVGRLIPDVVGTGGYEVFRPHIEKVLSGQRDEFETRVDFLPGGARWIHVVYVPTTGQDLKIDGWTAVLDDVTERHEAEDRLRKSEERFRATFFQAAVGIAQTSVDDQWRLFNDRLCEIVGYSREELREEKLIEITHPHDREASLTAREKLLAGEISSWSSEKRYIRKDGETVWARLFVSLVRDQHNEPEYFISVLEDITEKIQALRLLQQSRQELRALAGRLINAQEEERKRISRELHDDLSQKLALLAFNTSSLLAEPAPSAEKMNEQLRNLQARVQQLAQNARQLSHELHPSVLEDLGLVAALNELCEEFSAREGIEVMFEPEAIPKVLPIDLGSCLYRVSQEALHNVLKHAQASQARLKLGTSADGIHLCIRDNGVGFDSEAGLSRPGLGIVSMKERVRLVQGEFSIDSRPEQGTEVRVFVPLSMNAA